MNKLEQILERFDNFKDFDSKDRPLLADGFDDAVVGIDVKNHRMVYSVERCLSILVERDGMTYEEASEYFEFNIVGAYMGKMTPIYIYSQKN